MTRALVVGKFLPPHMGHHALIERAAAEADDVDVVVCDLAGQLPAAADRAAWLAAIHPDVRVITVPDICGWHGSGPCQPRCSPAWADHLAKLGHSGWDAVVTSEPYGAPFAAALGAREVCFDPKRQATPISGTAVREGVAGHWQGLHPVVRAGLTRHVVIVGAESTGTTTLARDRA